MLLLNLKTALSALLFILYARKTAVKEGFIQIFCRIVDVRGFLRRFSLVESMFLSLSSILLELRD